MIKSTSILFFRFIRHSGILKSLLINLCLILLLFTIYEWPIIQEKFLLYRKVYFPIMLVVFAFCNVVMIAKLERSIQSKLNDAESKALRAQMNPHFIFNSLNSISNYLAKNNSSVANDYVLKFARLMRLVLENSEFKAVPLARDIEALTLYMDLEALRMDKKCTFSIHVDPDIDSETTMISPLLLQPFVENSIWHGLARKQNSGQIQLVIKKEDDFIHCFIEDNGVGLCKSVLLNEVSPAENKTSLGIKITSKRIQLANRWRNIPPMIKYTDLQEGTRAEIKIPYEFSL